jgi:hypothetical protein
MTELDTTTAATVAKLVAVRRQIRDLTTEADTLTGQLRDNLQAGSYTINGEPAVSVTPTRRFNASLAAEVLPPALLALIQSTTVDAKLAREKLPPALYEACQVDTGKPTVRLA